MSTSPVHNQPVIPSNREEHLPSMRTSEPSDQQARTDAVAQRLLDWKLQENLIQRRGYNKRYYQLHREEINAKQRVYWRLHRQEINAKQRAYSRLHREEINTKQRAYSRLRKEERRIYDTGYRQAKKNGTEALDQFKKEYAERKKLQKNLDASLSHEKDKTASTSLQSSTIPSSVKAISIPMPPLPFPDLSQSDENQPWNSLPEQLIPQNSRWPEISEPLENFFDEKSND